MNARALSLGHEIQLSLQINEPTPSFEDALISKRRPSHVRLRQEGQFWDYKEQLDLRDVTSVAQLARHILGFFNAQGGALVYGVTNDHRIVGIPSSEAPDRAAIQNAIARYVGRDIPFFTSLTPISADRVLLTVFIPKRTTSPASCLANAPDSPDRKRLFSRGDYFLRVHDETRLVRDAFDQARLWSGFSPNDLNAYAYQVDQPMFRLLQPHCTRFVGRREIQDQTRDLLLSARQPVISLEGHGGVGKSAIAIQVVGDLFALASYDFIVSLSAKSSVWTTHSQARKAHFVGYTEFLCELAIVLGLDFDLSEPLPDASMRIADFMTAGTGLLLVDNAETISDVRVFDFLTNIPAPTKVLLTSRVDRRLSQRLITVPPMPTKEARELFVWELQRQGFDADDFAEADIEEMVAQTQGSPLAIRWSASLVTAFESIREALRRWRGKQEEFVAFCLGAMFDQLSPMAQDVAASRIYLGRNWHPPTISLALGISEEAVIRSMSDLQGKGVLLEGALLPGAAPQFAPHVLDYLRARWHQNTVLQARVKTTLSEAIGLSEYEGVFASWSADERAALLRRSAHSFEAKGEYQQALRVIRSAAASLPSDPGVRFDLGYYSWKATRRPDGLYEMLRAVDEMAVRSPRGERRRLAECLLETGNAEDQRTAVRQLSHGLDATHNSFQLLWPEFCRLALEHADHDSLRRVLSRLLSEPAAPEAYTHMLQSLEPYMVIYLGAREVCKEELERLRMRVRSD